MATPEGTKRYFQRHKAVSPIELGRTGWLVSPVGFGGYRVDDREPVYHAALSLALENGCNLIDTSSNYMDGGSEELVGQELGALFEEGKLSRDEIVVVTKAGYVQGANMELAKLRQRDGKPFNDMVEYHRDCWHCISPDFLEDQITRSLERLGLDRIDVLLLHNPEYFLKADGDHGEYYSRIRKAFAHLEQEVRRGRIQYYGISSNTFPEPKSSDEYTSLETVCELAEEQGQRHHFAAIQFPLNLYEPGAALEHNNSGQSVLELARAKKLGTLINRPLNAFDGKKMVRLADFPAHADRDVEEDLKDSLLEAMKVEAEYEGKALVPANELAWAHVIRENFGRLSELLSWKDVLRFQIRPSIDRGFQILSRHPEHGEWMNRYRAASDKLFQAMTAYLEAAISGQSKLINSKLLVAAPALRSSQTLSQRVIRVYRSLPGVDCVLVGMRSPGYVRDALTFEAPLTPNEAEKALASVG